MRALGVPALSLRPVQVRGFDAKSAHISPAEYFLLSRVDGRTPLRVLIVISGVSEDAGLEAVTRLWTLGAIEFPGLRAPKPAPKIDEEALLEDVGFTLAEKRAILVKEGSLEGATPEEILELDADCTEEEATGAYRELAKQYHPDRHRNKRLGTYLARLERIFGEITAAYDTIRARPSLGSAAASWPLMTRGGGSRPGARR